jgi:hypothetical protein
MLDFSQLVDFAGPVGLLCVLSMFMGEFRRSLGDEGMTQYLTGFGFGLVAAIEMNLPSEPFEGVIIDLRNIPIVLAGAFLGRRGLLTCLFMAIMTRVSIGGTGMISGVIAMIIAGYAGAYWDSLTARSTRRGPAQLLFLGVMTTASLSSIVFLPAEISVWFMKNALPSLALTYLTIVPLAGLLLQREILRTETELHLLRGTLICPESGLLRPASFLRQTAQLSVGKAPGAVKGLMVVTPTYPAWLTNFWGCAVSGRLEAGLAMALMNKMNHANRIGVSRDGKLLIPMTDSEIQSGSTLVHRLITYLEKTKITLPTGPAIRIRAKIDVIPVNNELQLWQAMQHIEDGGPTISAARARCTTSGVCGGTSPEGATSNPLFRKLDVVLAKGAKSSIKLDPG